MDYSSWIARERRIRSKILRTSPLGKDSSYRVCFECNEVCLCHEEECPNCGSTRTGFRRIVESTLEERIRCGKRFAELNGVNEY